MSRIWYWTTGAFVLVLVATLVPGVVGLIVLAPLAALAVGAAAAWVRVHSEHATLGQAISTATTVGFGTLAASVVASLLLGLVLGSDPAIQDFVRASEPYPEARLPFAWIPPLAAMLGGLAGLSLGLLNLALAALGGVLGAL